MVQILHVRVAAPGTHESHIVEVRWYEPRSGNINIATTATMVDFLRDKQGRAYTCDGSRIAEVEWVDATPPYIRTKPDARITDNLLALPKF